MKVIISPKFGAGWSTWCDEGAKARRMMLTDAALIEAIESNDKERLEAALYDFSRRYVEQFGEEPYIPTARDFVVLDVPQGSIFQIREYDGSESIDTLESDHWYIAE